MLVDEYQDVNRASAVLLRELVGDGSRLWAVGDPRQSIYRFRGASPVNARDFEKDYPTAKRMSLSVNYRSRKQIVDLFSACAKTMRVGRRYSSLEVKRGVGVDSIDWQDGNAERFQP